MTKRYVLTSLAVLFCTVWAYSSQYYWKAGSGNWNSPGRWCNQVGVTWLGPPSGSDSVYISLDSLNGGIISVPVSVGVAYFRVYDTGPVSTGTINFTSNNATFLVSGSVLIENQITLQCTASGQATWEMRGAGTHSFRTSGTVFSNINLRFETTTGTYTVLDDITNTGNGNGSFFITKGGFNAVGRNITTTYMQFDGSAARNVNVSNSTITANNYYIVGTGLTLVNAGTTWRLNGGNMLMGGTSLSLHNIVMLQNDGNININSNGVWNFNSVTFLRNGTFTQLTGGLCNINTIICQNGGTIRMTPTTIALLSGISLPGNCAQIVNFVSTVPATRTKFSLSNNITVSYCSFLGIEKQGPFSLTANNSYDMGQNLGITFASPVTGRTYYWCGSSSSNWSDPSNWSTDSMVCLSNGCLPSINDTVVINDQLSSSSLLVDYPAACRCMYWRNQTNAVGFSGTSELYVEKDITLSPMMTNTYTGDIYMVNTSLVQPSVIRSNGVSFHSDFYYNTPGLFLLADDFTDSKDVYFNNGTYNTQANDVTVARFRSENSFTRTLIIANSRLKATQVNTSAVTLDGDNLTMNATGSTVEISGTGSVMRVDDNNASMTFHNLLFSATTGVATLMLNDGSAPTFPIRCTALSFKGNGAITSPNAPTSQMVYTDTLNVTGGYAVQVTAGKQVRIDGRLNASSSCTQYATLSGLGGVANFITGPSFTSALSYLYVENITVNSPGFTPVIPVLNSFSSGTTSGWNIIGSGTQVFYWIGEGATTSWDDPDNWSFSPPTSGNDTWAGGCLPGPGDDVVFDGDLAFPNANPNKKVVINTPANCRNMTWTSFTTGLSPTLEGTSNLNIYGSLQLSSGMNQNFTGYTYFRSSLIGNTIRSNGRVFKNHIYFTSPGEWTLLDALTLSVINSPPNSYTSNLYHQNGRLITNGHPMTMYQYAGDYTTTRTLNISNSVVTIHSNNNSAWELNTTNLTMVSTGSLIQFVATFLPAPTLVTVGTNPVAYNNVLFALNTPGSLGRINSLMNGVSFNVVEFRCNSQILTSGHVFDTLIYAPRSENRIQSSRTQQVNELIAKSNPCAQLSIRSTLEGVFADICKSTPGILTVSEANLYDIRSNSCPGFSASYQAYGNSSFNNVLGWQLNGQVTPGFGFPPNMSLNCTNFPYTLSTASFYGGSGTSYLWNTGSTNADIVLNAPGTYNVLVTFAPGCFVRDTIQVGLVNNLALTTTQTNITCNGANNGSAQVNLINSSPSYAYNYNWTPAAANNDSVSGLAPGSYTVTVSDVYALCTATATITITQPAALSGTTGNTPVSCNGGANGTAQITPSGGTPGYTYQWNDPGNQTTAAATGLTAGTYTVVVTDQNGCTRTNSVTVTQPSAITGSASVTSDVLCFGGNSGQANISPSGGTPGYQYNWSSGSTSSGATGLIAGTYTVTVTDANNCTHTSTVSITEPTQLTTSITTPANVLCYGDTTGSATVTPGGGTPVYQYSWSSGHTTATAGNLAAGTYTVQVTDDNGCTRTTSVQITEPSDFTITTNSTAVLCPGGGNGSASIGVSGATPGYTYAWSHNPALNSNTASGLSAGAYTVTVTDASNCSTTASITVVQPNPFVLNGSQVNIGCNGASTGSMAIAPVGGTSPYTINWYDGGSNLIATNVLSLTNLLAGTYSVQLTDQNNCVTSQNFVITQAPPLSVAPATVNAQCNGSSTGSIVLSTSGGVGGYSYTWNPPVSSTASASNLTAGTYTVDVEDANNCLVTEIITLTEPLPYSVNVQPATQLALSCYGDSTGAVSILVSGSHGAPYSYNWSPGNPTGEGTSYISNLHAGNYTVVVTDSAGCQTQQTYAITQPAQISLSPSSTNNTCFGDSAAVLSVNPVSGGVAPYDYLWNTGNSADTLSTLSSVPAGSFQVTVTDANGCTRSQAFTVTQGNAISVGTTVTHITCPGGTTGTASLNVTGGAGGFQYGWTPSVSTSGNASNLGAGAYTVQVTDVAGCTSVVQFNLTEPPAFDLDTNLFSTLNCHGDSNAVIAVLMSGGNPGYSYSWSPVPAGSTGAGTPVFGQLPAGVYNLQVLDAQGCVVNYSLAVNQPSAITVSATTSPVDCAVGQNSGSALITPSGGTVSSGYQYAWTHDANNTTNTATGLSGGIYTVQVTDDNGCQQDYSFTLGSVNGPQTAMDSVNVLCFGDTTGMAIVNVTGGSGNYTYTWYNGALQPIGQTDSAATGLTAGMYIVEVNSAGCIAFDSVQVLEPQQLVILVTDSVAATCFNSTDASATISVSGGVSGYDYLWSSGDTTSQVSGLPGGIYTVTVQDQNGCSLMRSITLSAPDSIQIVLSVMNPITCNGAGNGTVAAFVSGGTPGYTYQWSNGASGTVITGLDGGTYALTVTDTAGCSQVAQLQLNEPAVLNAFVVSVQQPGCNDADGTITVGATGGTPVYTYTWPGISSDTTGTLSQLSGGPGISYTVMVTDAQGCSDSLVVPLNCVKDTLYIPQFISPNSDGVNDVFFIVGIENYPDNKVQVFNRFGNEVYSAENYDNVTTVFDGTPNVKGTLGSGLLPTATYFYVIDVEGDGSDIRTGFLELNP